MSAPSSVRSLPQAIGDLLGEDAPVMPMTEAYKQHFHAMRSDDGYTEALTTMSMRSSAAGGAR